MPGGDCRVRVRNKVAFSLSDALANNEDNSNRDGKYHTSKFKDGKESIKVPRDFKMVLSKFEQSVRVFSERPIGHIF